MNLAIPLLLAHNPALSMFLQWLWFFVILGTFSGNFIRPFLAENFFGAFAAIIETHAVIQQASKHVATNE